MADGGHVIRAEDHRDHDRGDNERSKKRPAEVVDTEDPVGDVQVGGHKEDHGVRDEDEQEAEDERERQAQRGKHWRDDRVQGRNDDGDEKRAPKAADVDTREIAAATSNATPVASHEMMSGNGRQRGRSGRHSSDWPYTGAPFYLALHLADLRRRLQPSVTQSG